MCDCCWMSQRKVEKISAELFICGAEVSMEVYRYQTYWICQCRNQTNILKQKKKTKQISTEQQCGKYSRSDSFVKITDCCILTGWIFRRTSCSVRCVVWEMSFQIFVFYASGLYTHTSPTRTKKNILVNLQEDSGFWCSENAMNYILLLSLFFAYKSAHVHICSM